MQPPSLWFRQSQSRFERKELYCTEKKLRKSDKSFDFILYYIYIYIYRLVIDQCSRNFVLFKIETPIAWDGQTTREA